MKLKPYACSISAIYGWVDHRALVVWATSKEKAKQIALNEAQARWPAEKGYKAHKVYVLIVPSTPPT